MIYLIANFLIGTCLASHACLLCDRWARGQNWLWGRSHCNSCWQKLSLLDQLPIISYLYLHGRCRYCGTPIPLYLFFTEAIGGFAFVRINFASVHGLLQTLFIFSLLLAAIDDAQEGEFPTVCLLYPLVIILFTGHLPTGPQIRLAAISFLPIASLLIYFCLQQKMCWGDFWVYLLLATYFGSEFANRVLLLAALLLLLRFFVEKGNSYLTKSPFVPYIFLALVFNCLAQ